MLALAADACGQKFTFGIVLYGRADVVPFGDRLAAVPFPAYGDDISPSGCDISILTILR
ncbi:hypothetical protein [Rhizobium sp. L9]|uniref:hypothetical protein n=1 Tax=Rhizobium sp. L9 TaxID=1340738 RepID=UPI001596E76A